MTLERLPDELWTSYLKRRLETEAFQFEEWEFDFLDPGYIVHAETAVNPELTIMVQRVIDFGTEKHAQIVAQAAKYPELPPSSEIGLVQELAYLGDNHEGDFNVGFYDDGRARAGRTTSLQAITRPLSRYKNELYDSSTVIDDIVRYAVEQRNPDRPIAVLERINEVEFTAESAERVFQKVLRTLGKKTPEQ